MRLQVRVALQALEEQSGSGFVRCLVGHGAAADACLVYARRYGSRAPSGDTSSPRASSGDITSLRSPSGVTSSPSSSPHPHTTAVRRLALLGGPHAVSPPPPGAGWRVLSVHGADDAVVLQLLYLLYLYSTYCTYCTYS